MSKNIKKTVCLIASLALCAGTMTACGADKTAEFLELIDKGDIGAAYDYYDDEIDGDKKEGDICDEIIDEMEDRYEKITELCFDGTIDDKDIEDLIELLDDLGVDEEDIEEPMGEWAAAIASKENYETALDLIDDEEFSSAMYYLELVDERDSNYEDAKKKLDEMQVEMAMEDIEYIADYIEDEDYYYAFYYIDYYAQEYSENETIMEALDGYYADAKDAMNTAIQDNLDNGYYYDASYMLSNAQEYYEESDYEEIKATVDTAVMEKANSIMEENFANYDYYTAEDELYDLRWDFEENEDLVALYDDLKNSYIEYMLAAAEEEAAAENYEMALSITEIAISEVGSDNTELNNKYNEYKLCLPVYINDLDYFAKYGNIYSDGSGDICDNTNSEHRHCYALDDYWGGEEYWAEYLINGNYSSFNGVCAVSYDQRSATDTKYFEVYGDGVLLYTSPIMTMSSMPVEFSIDVTGVTVLKIMYPGTDGDNNIATIYDGMLSPEEAVEEEPEEEPSDDESTSEDESTSGDESTSEGSDESAAESEDESSDADADAEESAAESDEEAAEESAAE